MHGVPSGFCDGGFYFVYSGIDWKGRWSDRQVRDGWIFPYLFRLLIVLGAVVGAAALAQWGDESFHEPDYLIEVVQDVRNAAFSHLEQLPLSYLDSHPAGDILTRISTDADQFSDGLLMGFTQLFTGVLTILGTLIFMVLISPGITLLVVLITPLSFFVAGL